MIVRVDDCLVDDCLLTLILMGGLSILGIIMNVSAQMQQEILMGLNFCAFQIQEQW